MYQGNGKELKKILLLVGDCPLNGAIKARKSKQTDSLSLHKNFKLLLKG